MFVALNLNAVQMPVGLAAIALWIAGTYQLFAGAERLDLRQPGFRNDTFSVNESIWDIGLGHPAIE